MKRVRPRRVLGSKDAEILGVSPITGGPRPQIELNEKEIELRSKQAGLSTPTEEIVAILGRLMVDYLIEQEWDKLSVNAKEANDFASRMDLAVRDIRPILDARLLSPFLTEEVKEGLSCLEQAATTLRRQAGDPRRGGGKQIKANRQLAFAKALFDEFEVNGWPLDTSLNSLMAKFFAICLSAVEEKVQRPDLILRKVKL